MPFLTAPTTGGVKNATRSSASTSTATPSYLAPTSPATTRPAQTQPAPQNYAFLPPPATPASGATQGTAPRTVTNPTVASMQMPTSFPVGSPFGPPPPPTQAPGNNMVNPGYTEQAFEHVQNRLLEDPSQGLLMDQYNQTQTPSTGQNFLNQNLGTLQGPGQGEQYWNQVQGQFMDPFAGEQFARQATQQFAPQGPASQFFDQAQQQYNQFTNYQGTGNAQGQYGANAAFGPTQGAQFYNQVGGSYDQTGRYTDPNLSAGQYAQTQQAFGDLPIAQFDPFYDRASQLATQNYNRQAAGRGVYGSSEALSGVGNIITDIEAQRANRSFDAEMQREQALQGRQNILGNQARMGDVSSIAGFGANLAGLETFGNLAQMAGDQTLQQQTMLGNQAQGADAIANQVQGLNLEGVSTYGNLAGQADSAETNRYSATTSAMSDADRTELARTGLGADIAFRTDDSNRADYQAEADVAARSAGLDLDRNRLGADIANTASQNDLARLGAFMGGANIAEGDRQARLGNSMDDTFRMAQLMADTVGMGMNQMFAMDQAAFEDMVETQLIPQMQAAGMSRDEQNAARENFRMAYQVYQDQRDSGGGEEASA